MTTLNGPRGEVLFKARELACKGSGGLRLAPGFAEKLIELRLALDEPMIVSSCCRSEDYNKRVGGVGRSFHIYDNPAWPTGGTCAIDIRCPSLSYKKKLYDLAWSLGWTIGVYTGFLHLDRRSDYTDQAQTRFRGS